MKENGAWLFENNHFDVSQINSCFSELVEKHIELINRLSHLERHLAWGNYEQNNRYWKRENEIIRISLREFRGHDYVDIRQYYKSVGDDFLPTKKGITYNPELIDEVIDTLRSLKE